MNDNKASVSLRVCEPRVSSESNGDANDVANDDGPVMPVRSLNESKPGVFYRLAVGYTGNDMAGNDMAWLVRKFEVDGMNNLDYRCDDE